MVLVVHTGCVQLAVRVAGQQRLSGRSSGPGHDPAIASTVPELAVPLAKIDVHDGLGTRAEVGQGVVLWAIVLGAGRYG